MVKKRIVAIFSVYLVISLILVIISFSQFYFYKNQINITYRNTTRIIGNVFNNFFYNFEGFQQQPGYPSSTPVLKINKLVERLVKDNGLAYLILKDDDTVLFSYGNRIVNGGRLELADISPFYFSEEKIIESTYILNNRSILAIGFKADEYFDSIASIRLRAFFTAFIIILAGFLFGIIFFSKKREFLLQEKYDSLSFLYKSVLDNLNDAVLFLNCKNEITLKNHNGERFLADFDKENDKVGFLSSSLEKIVTDFRNDNSRKIEDTEFLLSDEKGGDYTFLINLEKIDLPASKYKEKVEGIIACIRDISVYKKMEKELFEQKKIATMESMASGVAHEIRNPLNAINTILQELKLDFRVNGEQDEYEKLLTIACDEIRRINNIVENFINYSKPFLLNLQEVEIVALLQNTLVLLKKNKKLSENISFKFENNSNLKLIYLEGDQDGLKSLFFNIMKNAAEAIDWQKKEHYVKISVAFQENGKMEKQLVISVYDNGIGLSELEKDKIFDYYYTQKQDGLGLGLNICHKIVTAHRGLITVFGEKDKFAEIVIKLPYR